MAEAVMGRGGTTAALFFVVAACLFPLSAPAQNWTRVAEIPGELVNSIVEESGGLFAATDSAVYASTDGGSTWSLTPQQPPSTNLSTLFGHDGTVWLGTRGDGIFRSTDAGASWVDASAGLTGSARIIVGFTIRGDSLYAATGGQGVYLLNLLNPAAWVAYNTGLFQFGCTAITASGGTLVAGIGVYVFLRPAGASQWSEVIFDSSFSTVPLSLLRHDTSLFLGTSHGVYRSDTAGAAWIKADITQFPNRNIVALASFGSRVHAALNYLSDHWIFTTDDGGSTWDIHSHEFTNLLAMTVASGFLWAGRVDGLWYFPVGGSTAVGDGGVGDGAGNLPARYSLSDNYPNPFNPMTTIRFELPARSRVRLSVHSLLGGEVARLVDTEMGAGAAEATWVASGASSGAYFYRFEATSVDDPSVRYSAVRKLLVVR